MTENKAPYEVATQNKNPFSQESKPAQEVNAIAGAEQQRAIAEIQSAMIIAKRFPRDQMAAMDRILQACTRPTLAEGALYTYSKGGAEITGPSIRLAEAIAQAWGNMQFGIRELDQRDGESTVEAYSWDIESNTRQVKVFQVKHKIKAYGSMKELVDPRDIYELTANMGARRLRACILGTVPGDVVEAAVKQCEETMNTSCDTSPERILKMVKSFEVFQVTPEMIKKRIQCHIEAIRPAQVIQLGKIYQSLHDGMSKAADWFEVAPEGGDINDKINAATTDTTKTEPVVALNSAEITNRKEEAASSGNEDGSPGKSQQDTQENSSTTETLNESLKGSKVLPLWHPDNHKRKRWTGLVKFAEDNKDTWEQASKEHQDAFIAKWSTVVGIKATCPVSVNMTANEVLELHDKMRSGEEKNGRKIDWYKHHIDNCQSKITLNDFVSEHSAEIDEREDSGEIWDLVNGKLESFSITE